MSYQLLKSDYMKSKVQMGNILWDLDGTLVDSRYRLYKLFCDLTGEDGLSFNQYWDYKKQGYNQRKMLREVVHYTKGSLESFHKLWLENIEDFRRLRDDTLKRNVKDILRRLYDKGYTMFVVTNRQNYENTVMQLENLEILSYFKAVYNTAQKCKKSEIVLYNMVPAPTDIFVGDSDEDIIAAEELGIISVMVQCRDSLNISCDKGLKRYNICNYDDILTIVDGIHG